MGLQVVDVPERSRFEVLEDGVLAGVADYYVAGDAIAIPHAQVDPARGGRGIGTALVRGVLDELRQRGSQVVPQCPFVSDFIARHPDYLDLVPAGQRRRYGLPEADEPG